MSSFEANNLPRWMMRMCGISLSTTTMSHDEDGTDEIRSWLQFLKSPCMKRILRAVRPRQLPSLLEEWERPLRIALDLYPTAREHVTVYPSLCLLIKGHYYIRQYGKTLGRHYLFTQDPQAELVYAVASMKECCPVDFMERVVKDHCAQQGYIVHKDSPQMTATPLFVILEHEEPRPTLVKVMLAANPKWASTPFQKMFPFHQACRNGYLWETGLKELFYAYPNVLEHSTTSLSPLYLVAFAYTVKKKRMDLERFRNYQADYHDDTISSSTVSDEARHVLNTLFVLLLLDPTTVKEMKDVVHHQRERQVSL